MIKNKKTFLALIFIFSFACVAYVSQAGVAENGAGWLWGGTDNGAVAPNTLNTGLGWLSMNNVTSGGTVSYGVDIPAIDGAVTGHAWSENVGWVEFAPAGPYPEAPTNSAQRVGNQMTGWARIVSIRTAGANAGGWLGWIKLAGTAQNGSPYGVSIDATTGELAGYAWSNELGWIDFSQASTTAAPPVAVAGSCGTADIMTRSYAASELSWGSYTACDAGVSVPVLDASNFPAQGHTFPWSCPGSGGGGAASCTGYRADICVPTCAAITCEGKTCTDCAGLHDGTKVCRDANWREVSPN